jgi:hypothetical protein
MVQPARQCLRDGDLLRICNNVFAVQVVEAACVTQRQDSNYELALCI